MTVAGEMFEDRHGGIAGNGADEPLAAARDNDIDELIELEQLGDQGAVGGFDELDDGGIELGLG